MIKFWKRYWQYIIFSFFCVSISAWFLEILYSLILRHRFVLPGTLLGPWCPVYGTAFLALLFFLHPKDHKIYNFMKTFVIVMIVEYLASFLSDRIFHHIIWDYHHYFFNIHGRVCLEMTLLFAIMGYLMMYFVEPILRRISIQLGNRLKIIDMVFVSLFLFDILINIFYI